MSGFRFPLKRVLALRETQLSIEQADLDRLRLELQAILNALNELESRADRETEFIRQTRFITGAEISGIAIAKEWIIEEKKRLLSRIEDCQRAIAEKTAIVIEAERKVRLVERLKERRRKSWIEGENRQLEELAGETAIAGWRREH